MDILIIIYYTYIVSTVTIPLIITEPESQEALPGAMVTFSIVAMGDGLTYQWIKDMANIMSTDVNYSGAQSATLTIVAAREPEDEGVYDCCGCQRCRARHLHGSHSGNQSVNLYYRSIM